jgi:hypothetical protein
MTRPWTDDELDRIGAAEELHVAARRSGGTLTKAVPVWVVRVGDQLYVRSWRGTDGAWFRAARARGEGHVLAGGIDTDVAFSDADADANDAVDDAYREKYGRYPSYVTPMISARARATTLALLPVALEDQL